MALPRTAAERIREKGDAVVERWRELGDNFEPLIRMLDERQLDHLILALGIGYVQLDR